MFIPGVECGGVCGEACDECGGVWSWHVECGGVRQSNSPSVTQGLERDFWTPNEITTKMWRN